MRNGEQEQRRPVRSQLVNVLVKRIAILAAEGTAGAVVTNSVEGALATVVIAHGLESFAKGWLSVQPKGSNTFKRGIGFWRDGE
jgi:hypothetical protein